MSEDNPAGEESRQLLSLGRREPDIPQDNIWKDDALDRSEMANALTNLVTKEPNPLVISLSGNWGSGKTFFLRRWQADLESRGVKAIYFNAWEDDFCDDPLVAIIGQLSEELYGTGYKRIMARLRKSTKSLLGQTGMDAVKRFTGFPLDKIVGVLKGDVLGSYSKQRKTKNDLKGSLLELSQKVAEETGCPLVFVIDELDRCRPTFAIELLERAKHVFNIPNMVFVFGINRDELCSSIEQIYGKIKSDVYLRRFFDLEFELPESNSKKFCESMIDRYKLKDVFSMLSVRFGSQIYIREFDEFYKFFPNFCGYFNLSLRDIDYCLRSIILVARNTRRGQGMYPFLLSALIILRINNRKLYRSFIQGECGGGEVMDYFDKSGGFDFRIGFEESSGNYIYALEIYLYIATSRPMDAETRGAIPELKLIQSGYQPEHPEYLSKRTRDAGKENARRLLSMVEYIQENRNRGLYIGLERLSELVELSKMGRR